MAKLRKKLKRLGPFDWASLAIALWSAAVPVAMFFSLIVKPGLVPVWVWAICLAPSLLFVVVSLGAVGVANSKRILLSRDTLLWSWLAFLGAAARSGAGVIVGVVAGAGIAIVAGDGGSLGAIRVATYILFAGLCVWLLLAVVIWTARAIIDVAGRRGELESNLFIWLKNKKFRRAKELSKFLEDGASPFFVLLCGLGLLLFILAALAAIGEMLGS